MANSVDNLTLDPLKNAYSKYSNKTVDLTKGDETTSYLDFDSYLKVLATQMSNQDFNDPMSDSEMLQQMASYSMLEGIKNMTSQSNISYASSLVGKAVTVNDGNDLDTGIVESVIVEDGKPYLMVNGFKYDASTVSNITSPEIYNLLSQLINREVNVHGDTEDEIIASGKVTNVLMIDGNAYVIVDNKNRYSLKDISLKEVEEGTDKDTESGADKEEETPEEDTETVQTSVVSQEVAARSYMSQSQAVFSELMGMLDSVSGADTTTQSVANSTAAPSPIDGYAEVKLDVPDYAAGFYAAYEQLPDVLTSSGVMADDDTVTSSVTLGASNTSAAKTVTANTALRSGPYDIPLNASNINRIAASSRTGNLSPYLSNSQVYGIIMSGEYSTRYNDRYGLEVYSDSKPGISTSDCVPHRLNPEAYPEETALADALGTRMYDVRFIHNTAITSRINTSTVIGKTISGREITEIGYCGKGRLGEVVTFKDGKQRVEILFDNGNSGWLETSGKYTIDQIINDEVGGDVTAYEHSIAFYAKSQTAQAFENKQSVRV